MTTYRLWPSTNGPASATGYTLGNPFISGVVFAVSGGGIWFEGFWWWVAGSGGQNTAATKCALWMVGMNGVGTVVPGSIVTSGTLTAGQWNYIPLSTPVQLAPSYDPSVSTTGSAYIAAVGCNGPFPDTGGYWGSPGAGAGGIVNGPLVAYSAQSGSSGTLGAPWTLPQGVFSTGGTDPSTTMPNQQSTVDNFWVDVQVSNTGPGGYSGSYRLWPNKTDANSSITGDSGVNYTIATEIDLTAQCTLNNVWFFSPSGAVNLPTRADVWDIGTGLSAASITSPSWQLLGGGAASAGDGWISAAFAPSTTLGAGSYRVGVYNANGTAGIWGPKDAVTNYWGQGGTGGVGSAGITWGPLSAPAQPSASSGWEYNASDAGATPPYSNGTAIPAQPPFGQLPSGLVDFPQLYAPVGGSSNQSQNYFIDLEATPVPVVPQYVYSMRRMP